VPNSANNHEFENLSNESSPRRLLRQLIEHAPDAMMVIDDKDKIMVVNRRIEQLFGFESHILVGKNPQGLFPEWTSGLSRAIVNQPLAAGGNVHNMTAYHSNGSESCAEVSFSIITIENHQFVVAGIRETTPNSLARHKLETINQELIETNEKLQSLSVTDPLTEVLNRRGLENVLIREISYSNRNKTDLLAVIVDLDDFKSINDNNGHATGDRVLRQVAQVLKSGLRTIDWIGRVGGDEFLILLPNTSLTVGIVVAERICASLTRSEIANLRGRSKVTASLGLVQLPGHTSTIEEVLELTTSSLKASKESGKNQVNFEGDNVFSRSSQNQSAHMRANETSIITSQTDFSVDSKRVGFDDEN
jgi:diguanylate cyclase (GGDEF)-like protein/PAS domain S-box-containing protein